MGHRFTLLLAVLLLAACDPSAPESRSAAPLDVAAEQQAALSGIEAGELPPLPTHWIHPGDIGNNQGPVTARDLGAGTADPGQWRSSE